MDKKISELNVAIDLTDADVLPIVNGGETKKVTIAKLKESMPQAPTKTSDLVNDGSNGTDPFITINDVPNPSSYELLANKQNSLVVDGTGTKYPTVDAVNGGIANVNTNAVDRVTVKLGSAITKGQAVYVSSATGTNIVVSKASNLTEATSSKVIGLLETTGALNDILNVITYGLLEGLNTSTALIGDPVWLGSNGELIYGLANKPFAPAHLVSIGIVTRVNNNNGEILVKIQNGFELKEIHDVNAQNPSDKDIISYNFASKLWTNNTLASILPQITITDTFVVASQVAMLAIVGETGDVAVRTDLNKTFILKGTNPTVLANWQELLTPLDTVPSVFNRTGNVVSNSGDYTADQITETATRKFQTANQNTFNDATSSIQTQLNVKAIDTNVVHLTGNETIAGTKTFSSDIVVNELTIGKGSGNNATNTAVGRFSILSNIAAANNTGIGYASLINNQNGSNNVAIGSESGRYISGGLINATFISNSVFIGKNTYPLADGQTNQIVIGNASIGLGSNTTVLGNASTVQTWLGGKVTIGTTVNNGTDQLQVVGSIKSTSSVQVGNNTLAASLSNVGAIRYRSDATSSYMDMVMQTGASVYTWVNIVTNTF